MQKKIDNFHKAISQILVENGSTVLDLNKIDNKQKITIPIEQRNGSYYVVLNVCGKFVKYLIDSGASNVTITSETENEFLEKKIITKSSYLSSSKYMLADGSTKIYKRIMIPWVKIKGVNIENVTAALSENNTTPLLGKSFFDKFSYWKINNSNNTLELQKK